MVTIFRCIDLQVVRDGRWAVSYEEYNKTNIYPKYCSGALNVLSMETIHGVAKECPNHCIGYDRLELETDKPQSCFWKFEDTHLGSCIFYTQKNTTMLPLSHAKALFVYKDNYQTQLPYEKHLVVFEVENAYEMILFHTLYKNITF